MWKMRFTGWKRTGKQAVEFIECIEHRGAIRHGVFFVRCLAKSLFNEVAGDAPFDVFVEHGRDGLDAVFSILEAGVVLNLDVLAWGVPGRILDVGCALEFARKDFA